MADTTDYMIMGYAAAFVILLITVGSVWLRYQQAARNIALIEKLVEDGRSEEDAAQSVSPRLAADEL